MACGPECECHDNSGIGEWTIKESREPVCYVCGVPYVKRYSTGEVGESGWIRQCDCQWVEKDGGHVLVSSLDSRWYETQPWRATRVSGWVCPRCNRVYGPSVRECGVCNCEYAGQDVPARPPGLPTK